MADMVILEFKTEYKGDRAIDWVHVAPSGEAFDRVRTWHRIKDVKPPENVDADKRHALTYVDMSEKWKVIGPAYEAWKKGEDVPETGTPLAAWAGVSTEQAAVLKRMGIRTVEDVSTMSDSTTDKLNFPNARKLPALAKTYLDGKGQADTASELVAMREKMAVMEEMLVEASKAAEAAKSAKSPGRPKKVEQEADAA